jgi:hypothetical protein
VPCWVAAQVTEIRRSPNTCFAFLLAAGPADSIADQILNFGVNFLTCIAEQ